MEFHLVYASEPAVHQKQYDIQLLSEVSKDHLRFFPNFLHSALPYLLHLPGLILIVWGCGCGCGRSFYPTASHRCSKLSCLRIRLKTMTLNTRTIAITRTIVPRISSPGESTSPTPVDIHSVTLVLTKTIHRITVLDFFCNVIPK